MSLLQRCRALFSKSAARDTDTAEKAPATDTASEHEELESAYHVHDTFREPRQVEQLQRLLDRYHAQQNRSR